MTADYLSFKTAAARCILGLAIQLVLGLVVLFYGLEGRDSAAITAAMFVLLGVPPWLALAIVFDQHRRERIEAAEADAFAASDAATSSVFESQASDLRVAGRRLASLYRWLLPAVSIGTGAALLAVGFWRFRHAHALIHADSYTVPQQRGWAISIGLILAFVGFLFARYISGMAKQPMWANLRGGAAYAVGSALMGLAIAIAHFIDITWFDAVLRYLPMAFAIAMMVLGGEIFLNFVLDLYRPRKAGEYGRPAFDSRILGFVAAPDLIAESIGEAINYQFGYEVSESWFYKLLQRAWWKLAIIAVAVVWGMTAFTVIQPHERGLVLHWGRLEREIGPGPHLKWPWPIETVEVPEFVRRDAKGAVEFRSQTVTGIRTINLGTPPATGEGAILWTNEHHHAGEEEFLLVQANPLSAGSEESGQGLAAASVEMPLHYSIDDLEAYERLGPPEIRDDLLRAVAQREAMRFISGMTINQILSGDRQAMAAELSRRMTRAFAALNPDDSGRPRGAGVKVLYLGIEGAHPPRKDLVARSFEQVVEAEQKNLTKVYDAQAEAIKTLTAAVGSVELADRIAAEIDQFDRLKASGPAAAAAAAEQELKVRGLIEKAGGNAAVMIVTASADRWTRQLSERGRLLAYRGQLASYRASPDLFRASLYMDALRDAMKDARVFIVDPFPQMHVRGEFQDQMTGQDVFTNQTVPKRPDE